MNKTLAAFDSLQPLEIKDFTEFYRATHGNENNSYKPFAWQERLAEQVCCGTWPDFLKLPTSSGKTAAIDIAVFALAYQACAANRPQGILTAARRIFFVVDRRIIVNEAYRQTRKTAQLLWDAVVEEEQKTNSVLKRVGKWLQTLANDPTAPPLDCFELRGGIYRDDAWVRSPMQPTVLTSTVDQVGSRMLFRGYGVSDRNLSIHAAMTTCDSLIILDEAHCSNPFSQTVESIARYRSERWADEPVATPFSLVQMTATPPQYLGKKTLFSLHEHDYEVDAMLEKRHACAKPTILVHDPSAKGKTLPTSLAKKFLQHTQTMVDQGCKKIAVVVNRIAIARETFKLLHSKYGDRVSLMIGRMRPIDREVLTTELQSKFASGLETVSDLPQFVVATQCLEVGADLDFDGMISQCASLDALRQRFGRLNRLGNTTNCYGVIVAAEGDIPPEDKLNPDKPLDPVYGNALARTWHWLNDVKDVNGEIDFGIKAFEKKSVGHEQKFGLLCAPSPDAPVLMPAHVDMLCQTSPRPTPEPEVASYLHGPNRGLPEVRVCWRADLKMQNASTSDQLRTRTRLWNEAVAICPPSSAECLSVPVFFVKKWLRGEKLNDSSSDVLGETEEEDVPAKGSHDVFGRCVLVWKGTTRKSSRKVKTSKSKMNENGSYLVDHTNLDRLRTGDTIVIPAEFGGWIDFGYVPNAPHEPEPNAWFRNLEKSSSDECETNSEFASIDVADTAFAQSRARTILRVHEKLRVDDYAKSLFKKLLNEVRKPEADLRLATWTVLAKQIVADVIEARRDALVGEDIADASTGQHMSRLQRLIELPGTIDRYPDGLAWTTGLHPDRPSGMPPLPIGSYGDDEDLLSQTGRLPLRQHLADVFDTAIRFTEASNLSAILKRTITHAAKLHDIGKADPRFQAMLLGKPVSVAHMQRTLWAKSDKFGGSSERELPSGFRHEMLSVDLLHHVTTKDHDCGNGQQSDRELLAHVTAAHHGCARPLAPVAADDSLPGFNLDSFSATDVSHEERASWIPSYRLDSGIGERFWNLNRRFGWWGLAYLESMLRLADWAASARPGKGNISALNFGSVTATSPRASSKSNRIDIVLTGD